MYIIPVLLDVYYSCIYCCTLILYSKMQIIPVLPDVYHSSLAWCTLFLIPMLFIILLYANLLYLFFSKKLDVPYSCIACCTLFWCILILFQKFGMLYIILMYTNLRPQLNYTSVCNMRPKSVSICRIHVGDRETWGFSLLVEMHP